MKKNLYLLFLLFLIACRKEEKIDLTMNGNKLPVANAGGNKNIVLPVNSITLTGTGTDEDGTITAYNWSYISGPAQYTIVSPNQSQTEINNLVKGQYQFQLKVTDNEGGEATDRVTINVTDNPTTNPPDAPAGTVIAAARIVQGNHPVDKANGDAMIYNDNGKWNLFLSNFSSVSGPDVRVYLSTDANASTFIDLGRLKAFSGNQTYAISGNPSLSTYKYVIIWCKQFGIYFGGGELK